MVGKPQHLNQGWPSAQSLVDLIDELKQTGYNIGVAQYIAAQDLLLALMTQSAQLNRPELLRSSLGPLLCSSPTEQADFQYRFDQWAERIGLTTGPEQPIDAQAEKLDQELRTVKQQQRRWMRGILAFLIALVLSLNIFDLWPFSRNESKTDSPAPTEAQSPTGAQPEQTTPIPQSTWPGVPAPNIEACPEQLPWWSFLQDEEVQSSLLLPLPLFLLWRRLRFWQAHQFLVRREKSQAPELERISIIGIDEHLFPAVTFLQIAQGLRRRIRIASSDLDIPKTVWETARKVGWFTPVYGYRQVLPEYLVLIDRTSPDDHQARFIESILDRLVENGVFIVRYFFKGDPRICFPMAGQGPPCQLQELIAKHGQDRLVMFSDAEGLLSAQTGEMESWMAVFSAWSDRAVLTPEPPQHWGAQERELAQQFTVLPLTITGLFEFIYSLDLGRSTFAPSGSGQAMLPSVLRERPRQWLQQQAPDSETVDSLLASLRRYLGANGYGWLCACAVFPALHWDLTLYLGQALQTEEGQPLMEPQRLIDMARLPWFRYAYLPDWLRLRLIESFPRQQEQNVRKALEALLLTAVEGPVSWFQLEIAGRKYEDVVSWLVAPLLDLLSRQVSRDSPLKDYIFRDFMAGLKPSRLAVRLPEGRTVPVRLTRRRLLQLVIFASTGLGGGLLLHRVLRSQDTVVTIDATGKITKRQRHHNELRVANLGWGVRLDLMRIPVGTFSMGSPAEEEGRKSDEGPQHSVTVPAFWMGKYPVTQAQWRAVAALPKIDRDLGVGADPSLYKGNNRPVEGVSWEDAVEFCKRLSTYTGCVYRLPSEAEWEYACRAGTTTPFHFGETITTDLANYYSGWDRHGTTNVGSFNVTNAFGLYDMHGNVWEWCLDYWHESYEGAPTNGSAWTTGGDSSFRVLRGGAWGYNPDACRSANRGRATPDTQGRGYGVNGFRVVCVSS